MFDDPCSITGNVDETSREGILIDPSFSNRLHAARKVIMYHLPPVARQDDVPFKPHLPLPFCYLARNIL